MYGCCMFSFTSKAMPSVHQAKKLRDSGVPIGWIRGRESCDRRWVIQFSVERSAPGANGSLTRVAMGPKRRIWT